MSRNYDNWERLVAAVIKKQQLLELFHAHSRSPSVLSDASEISSIFSFDDVFFGYWIPRCSFPYSPALVFISDYDPAFDLNDLLRASTEKLGRESFGSFCAAKLQNGITIDVKRLKMFNISKQDFKTHMRIIGDAKHENVAPLRAYYYSTMEKLMIYDYYTGGSVFALLHGKPGENRANVDWEVRLRIAVGAARGIWYIHKQNGGKLVHGNIKSSNIFINSRGYGIVSDLGLATMIPSTFPQSSRCYAPEVKSTRNVSRASDVYSYGILLLELLTRKSPHPSLGHDAVDLVKLVNSEEWNKVLNGDLLLNSSIRKHIVRMLLIGKSCVEKSRKKRPEMSAVVKMMDDICMMGKGDEDSVKIEMHRLVFLGDGNPTFDLEDLLWASTEVLEKGTFATSYKVILKEGTIIFVKRLKEVMVTNGEFQQHMKIVGRMGHKNVINLMAYYYSRDEKLLVYDYYDQGSLSTTLHGNRDSGNKRPLDWNTRLSIAMGVAKGIAHIHTKDRKKLVHGNISASNILLNEQQCGIISDVGLGKLVHPTTSFANAGYCAPEMTDNRNMSQASDVYSFGVVLLELLTGRPPQTRFYGTTMALVRWIQIVLMDGGTIFDAEVSRSGDVDLAVVQVMQLARRCVANVPQERPKMADIVKMLEKIRDTVTSG